MSENIYAAGAVIAGRYEIESFLAAGGMQEVYVASDRVLKRRVALKTPKNDSASKRFEGSAVLSARISHPFVAKTYDYLVDEDRAHLLEELVPGGNLEVALEKHMPTPDPHIIAQCLHQLAKALRASHAVGVVHRDLKPSNIVIDGSRAELNFKVTDFGIAKLTEEELERANKTPGTILNSSTMFGALPYMSPEVIDNPRKAGTASDVWALGAIIYRMLSGVAPFGEGLKAIPKIVSGKPPSKPEPLPHLTQFKQLSAEIWEIIKDCFEIDVNKRQTAATIVDRASTLCYSVQSRMIGQIANYPAGAGGNFGFIVADGVQYFFHRDSFFSPAVHEGQRVYFSAHPGRPKNRAHPISALLDEA
ncbi:MULTISPECIES: serine/threonine-protein kinase [unclassified Caballeronia]|uniref:serine/threonine-protein kinase n=1 Tax=unclassified Caballeronia TaxID=2646786 RepID=UPI00285B1BC5|nr:MULTISPECIES: serine/threonine-protein kinase [unclassified Caballeronia]MDR5776283.1 serine/threonine-protein kinase [Caballeronia sp. LZ002]MDR5851935.1 serine/threonine-protein kinase [Caballeronia sp. LZ003]